jgi:alkylhydroperoxidase/carboxymuconolactone decarboxylase family protein YurZ
MPLAPEDRALVRLSVAIVVGDWERLRELRRSAAPAGGPDRAWREALLQTHLFAGFPRLVEACGVLAEEGGIGDVDALEEGTGPEDFGAGARLFDRIYEDHADSVRRTLGAHHPALARWVAGHAYGRVLSRPGLDAGRRELLAVACLAALGQDRQLASHARGAIRCGATVAELEAALTAINDLVDAEPLERARRVVAGFAR